MTKEKAQLFKGKIKELKEIENEYFPFFNTDDYEYNRLARGSFYTGYAFLQGLKKDPSVMEEVRRQAFLQKIDDQLTNYYIDSLPLVVCGELKEVAYFKKITRYDKVISSFMVGNYLHLNQTELADRVWPTLKSDLDEKRSLLINVFKESVGMGSTETGIINILQAARDGRAFRLLVEKDYSVTGYLNARDGALCLQAPEASHRILPDALDEVIDKVLEQRGEVIFIAKGALQDYGHIALFTRYGRAAA